MTAFLADPRFINGVFSPSNRDSASSRGSRNASGRGQGPSASVPALYPDQSRLGPVGYRQGAIGVINVVGLMGFELEDNGLCTGTPHADIIESIRSAAEDPVVERVLIDVHSGGGCVAGITDLARAVDDLAAIKPVVGFAHDAACSAAYWLLSGCTEIVATPTAEVGSIGVIVVAEDSSRMHSHLGIRPVVVSSGGSKAFFVPGTKIGEEATAELRAVVDHLATIFFGRVKATRGVSWAQMAQWDGKCFRGREMISAGLVDRIELTEDLHKRLLEGKIMPSARIGGRAKARPAATRAAAAASSKPAAKKPKTRLAAHVSAGAVFHALMARQAGSDRERWQSVTSKYPKLREAFTEEECNGVRQAIGMSPAEEAKFTVSKHIASLMESGCSLEQARKKAGEKFPNATRTHLLAIPSA